MLTACHRDRHSPATYALGGSISGLISTGLVLQNAGTSLTVNANAIAFQFQVAAGADYNVTIATQPDGLTCSVSHGSGTRINANVTDVGIVCNAITHAVSGTITGLTASGLVLINNGADDLSIPANATTFEFTTPIADGSGYNVAAFSQPTGLTCTVSNGAGTQVRADVSSVIVTCNTTHLAVGGTISGLTGSGLVLQNNAGDNLAITAPASSFQFATPVAYASHYEVTVLTQPAGQICSLTSAMGNATAAVDTIAITCSNIITYTLTSSSGPNGSVSPSGTSVVNSGGSKGYAAVPDAGYAVDQWLLDGSPVQSGGSIYTLTNITSAHTLSVTFGQATLSLSASSIALSVNCPIAGGICVSADPALTGNPRQLVITNTGSLAATHVSVAESGLPSGTAVASDTCSGSNLAPAASCVVTIAPGQSATSDCSTGVAPTPGQITVSSDNASSAAVDVNILTYGCQFQGGFLYAIDDTTQTTGSIGGKVLSRIDQAPAFPSGVLWSSNGAGTAATDVSYDLLPGIDEISTISTGSPSYSVFAGLFASDYTNPNPFTGSSFSACNGNSDGQCNSSNIRVFYNQFATNNDAAGSPPYTASPGPTSSVYYAAGLCSATIDGYSDWYLPAVCELDSNGGAGCATGSQNVVSSVPTLLGDPNSGSPSTSCTYGANCLAGYYWSSTEYSNGPQNVAWGEYFSSGGGSTSFNVLKRTALGVRCSRALTQ